MNIVRDCLEKVGNLWLLRTLPDHRQLDSNAAKL